VEATTGVQWSGKDYSGSVTKLLGDRPLYFRKQKVSPTLGTVASVRLNPPDYPVLPQYRITLQNLCAVEGMARIALRVLQPVR
jgi:hypothetical protein